MTDSHTGTAERPRLGPRQQELLDGWRTTVQHAPSGIGYNFTAPDPRVGLEAALDEFRDDPTTDTFAALWETLRRTTTPYGYILGKWEGSIDDLAAFLHEVRLADEWHSDWADLLRSPTWLFELFSRTAPHLPVVDTQSQTSLRRFGIRVGDDFPSSLEGMRRFQRAYEDTIGHVTADTEYEVPITRELDELFALLHEFPKTDLPSYLLGRDKPVYEPLTGFAGTTHDGGPIELDVDLVETAVDAYAEGIEAGAYNVDPALSESERSQYWCGNYDEEWKHDAARAVSDTLHGQLDGTALSTADLNRVLDVFDEGHGAVSDSVIKYLMGPRQGWRVWDAFEERTFELPEVSAAVLSRLFDPESAYVTGRLDLFEWHYEDDDALRVGALMKLATGLLMLAWPDRYVQYQYGRCKAFFDDVCVSGFEVETGYNPIQYHRINEAATRLRDRIDERIAINRPVTMCDVHSLFYFWGAESLA